MDDLLLEPLKYYEKVGKEEHKQNTEEYFEKLLQESGVDVEQNRETVKEYKKEQELAKDAKSVVRKRKTLRVFLIIGIVICAILGLVGVSNLTNGTDIALSIIFLLIGIVGIVGGIILLVKKVNPAIRNANDVLQKHLEKADELLAQAEAQMAPLNALFDNMDTFKIIEKTIPDFKFDDKYTVEQEDYFVNKHDFIDFNNDESSILDTLSGRFAGNPFLFCNKLVHEMGTQTYHGSLVISWTEVYYDSNGNRRTRTRTQTLHASVVKPKPYYYTYQYLYYGNQAAPDLTFSRDPQHSEKLSEKALDRRIKKGEKDLKKKAEKSLKKGGSFQEMANSEFDVLFGADDRDHEMQFRLMFTPLGQRNTVDLLKSSTGYGDDFYFQKYKRFNVIISEHGQNRDLDASPSHYYSYDVDVARLNFINFNVKYFKSIFFDFAPLLSIPAYVEEPCASLEPIDDTYSYYTYYEHEVLANALGGYRLAHEETATNAIFKTEHLGKAEEGDVVNVTAYSYAAVDRVDFIPVYGGDGNYHNVPVPWVEYIPLEKQTKIFLGSAPASVRERRAQDLYDDDTTVYTHGMFAKML